MGCCAAKRRPGTWSPNPLLGFRQGYFSGFVPAIGDVETSAGAVFSKRSGGSCCDACDAEHAKHPAEEGSCSSGACGINQFTAGMRLPLNEYSVNARQRQAGATMDEQASAWTRAAFGGRQAGVISPVAEYSASFRRSSEPELRSMSDAVLGRRAMDLQSLDIPPNAPVSVQSEYETEASLVDDEYERRRGGRPQREVTDEVTDDPTDRPLTEAEFREKKAELGREVAERLEPGSDPASRARRDAIIAQAITGTLATFNNYLQREYDAQVTTINANRDVTLQTLRNEDRERERQYRLQLRQLDANLGITSGGGGGGGGGAAIVGIGLVGLLLSMAKK